MKNAHASAAQRRTSRRFILEHNIARMLATALTCAAAHAATVTWDITPGVAGPGDGFVTGGLGMWDLATGNWTVDGGVNNVAWVNNVVPDSAVFGGAAGAVTLGEAITANALTFDTAGYSISGNVLTLAGATPAITTNADASIGSVLAGTAGFTKLGAGQLTLDGAGSNTFTGTTIVDRGTLVLGKTGGAFAIVGNVQMGGTVGNEPNLRMAANEQFGAGVVMTFVNPAGSYPRFDLQGTTQTLAGISDATGAGVIQNEKFGGGGTSGPATLTLNASAGSLSFNGYMRDRDGGPGIYLLNLVKSGAGIQELAGGSITYTGTTTVNAGTLRLTDTTGFASDVAVAAPGTLNLNTGGAMSFGRVISGTGTVLRTGGTTTINGASSNTFSGTTIIDSGTTILAKTGGATAVSGTVQMGGGNGNQPNLRMGADNQFAAGTVMTTANVAGNWTRFDLVGTSQTLAGAQDLNGGLVIQNGGVGAGSATDATIAIANATDFTLNSHIRDFDNVNDGGKLNLVKSGAGTLTLGHVPGVGAKVTYTGTTTVDGGRLELLNGTAFASATTVNSGGIFRISNDLASSPYSPLGGGAAIVVNADGVLELNNATTGYANRKTLSGSVSGAGTINVIGTGFLALNGVNNITLSGQINVLSGGLGNDGGASANAFGTTTAGLNISAGAFFDLRGGAPQFGGLSGAGLMMNSYTANTLTLGAADGSGVFTGTMQNGGNGDTGTGGGGGSVLSLTKIGTGTQTLAGNGINYTGATTITSGTLRLDTARNFSSAITLPGGSTLGLRTADTLVDNWTLVAPVTGTGTIVKDGVGWFKFRNAAPANFEGTIQILDGRLGNGYNTTVWTNSKADIHIAAGAELDLRTDDIIIDQLTGSGDVVNTYFAGETNNTLTVGVNDGSSQYDGVIRGIQDGNNNASADAGRNSLSKVGTGTFITTGAHTYIGTTSVTGGVLQVGTGGTGNLGTGTVTIASPGALVFNSAGVSPSLANGVTGNGTVTQNGPGTQTFAGAGVNYTGATTVNGGTLKLQNATNFNSIATVNSGGTLVVSDMTNFDFASRALISAGGTLEINSSIPFLTRWNYGSPFGGATTVNKTGPGVFGANGQVNLTGALNILEGRWMNDSTTSDWTNASPDVAVSAGAVFDLRANAINVDELSGMGEVWNSHPANGFTQNLTVGLQNGSSTFGGIIMGDGSEAFDNPNGGSVRLTKVGSGTLTLTGANTYSGTTTISGGTLQIGNGGATGNLSTGAVTNNAALAFNLSGTSTVANGISGTGTLGKLGTGLVALTGNPSHTGATGVSNGTLAVVDGTAWNSDAAVSSPGVFAVANSGSGTWNYTKAVTGNGTFAKGGAGTVRVLNNLATYTGPTHVESGVLQFTDATAFASSGVTVASGGSFEMNRSGGPQTLSAPVSGTGHFTKSGAGEVLLAAALTNSGDTSVRAGTLIAGAANQLSASGTLTVGGSGAAAARLNGFSQTVGGLAGSLDPNNARVVNGSATPATLTVNLASGQSVFSGALGGPGADENNLGLVKQGAGTLVFTGQSTHTGGITIAGGTVQLGASTTAPASLTSASIWLDGADPAATGTAPADGSAISVWKNKGALGATGDFSAAAGFEPSYGSAGAGLMNGNSTVRFTADATSVFDPQANYDRLTNPINLASGASTILVAGRYASADGDQRKRLVSSLGNNWLLGWWNNGVNGAYYDQGFVPGTSAADTNAHTYSAVIRGDGSADTYSEAGRLGSGGGVGPAGLSLGGGYLNNNGESSTGDVGELIVVQGILSDSDRAAIEGYLARKWTGYLPTNPLPTTGAVSLSASGATLDVNGVTQTLGSLSGVAGTSVVLGGGYLTVGDASSTIFAGGITGSGGFTKVGTGTLELSGTSTPSGNPVLVQGGTLLITGSLSGSTVEVQSGGTLGGNGTLGSDVYILGGGKLSPGTSPGTLTVTGTQLDVSDAVFGTGTQALVFELGTASDRVNITTGQFGLGLGVLEFDDFAFTAGIGFGPGTYTLFDSTQDVFGTLGANLAGTIGAFGATLSLADTDNDLVLTVVPEPGSAALLLAGLACFGLRRRRD